MQEIQRIGSDVKYLRNIVEAKQKKLEAKRERKRREVLAQQRKEQAERNRRIYENLVGQLNDLLGFLLEYLVARTIGFIPITKIYAVIQNFCRCQLIRSARTRYAQE